MNCSICHRYMYLFNVVRVALVIDFSTGLYTEYNNVCKNCDNVIAKQNDFYRSLLEHFTMRPGTLEKLRQTHMEDLAAS